MGSFYRGREFHFHEFSTRAIKAAYMSGFQKNQRNSFRCNYIYDSFDHSSNDYAWYNDMDQDTCELTGNMVNGVKSAGNQPETAPLILTFAGWAESDGEATGSTVLLANVSIHCSFCDNDECTHTLGDFIEKGAIKNSEGGHFKSRS